MTLDDFKDCITKIQNKKTYVKQIMSGEYIPIMEKIALLDTAIKNALWDPTKRYFEYIKFLIHVYTIIDVEPENPFEVYDVMQSTGVLPILLSEIGEDKIKEINMLLALETEKIMGESNE